MVDFNIDSVTLSWEPPENDGGSAIRQYIVEKRDAMTSTWMQAGVVGSDVLQYHVDSLFEGRSYFFRVTAENECGRGQPVETVKPVTARLPYGEYTGGLFLF